MTLYAVITTLAGGDKFRLIKTSRARGKIITPRENPGGFSSGGVKRNGQNPDTMEAKTVKTKINFSFLNSLQLSNR